MQSIIALLASALAVANAAPSTVFQTAVNSTDPRFTSFAADSNSWAMSTWTGTSCTGSELFWSVPDGNSCTNLASVSSLKVTNTGGCSTTYFIGSGCQNDAVHVNTANVCDGYSDGSRIGSFSVSC